MADAFHILQTEVLTDPLGRGYAGEDWAENPIYSFNMASFKEMLKKRVQEVKQYESQKNADLNASMGQEREAQHWIVALNAAQTRDEEPETIKMAK